MVNSPPARWKRSVPRNAMWRFVLMVMLASPVLANPVDVALNKPVEVNITCGTFGEETYYEHSDIFQLPSRRRLKTCTNATHPPPAMVDGNPDSWWQSMSRSNLIRAGYGVSDDSPQAIITIDLLQVCIFILIKLLALVTHLIRLKSNQMFFVKAKQPDQMTILTNCVKSRLYKN